MEAEARPFYRMARIMEQVRTKLKRARDKHGPVGYVSFVPDGVPTLDAGLGSENEILRAPGIRVAVITNGVLLWREDVSQNLRKTGRNSMHGSCSCKATNWTHDRRSGKNFFY